MTKKVAIIGGSMAGLCAALLLEKNGWHVDIFEKSREELSGRGAGIITHPPLFSVLKAIGINDYTLGVELLTRRLISLSGELILEKDFPQISASWDKLFSILRVRVKNERYHLNKQLVILNDNNREVLLTFADGSKASADLVIGADGFRSTLRTLLLPEVKPEYAGYLAWRGMVEENKLSKNAQTALMHGFTFCLPPHEQFLGYPVVGANTEKFYNYVWYQNVTNDDLKRFLTDEEGTFYPDGIAPHKIAQSHIFDLKKKAHLTLAPLLAEVVEATRMPFFQQIYDVAVPKMVIGRVALIGDAAFVARPHVGAGVTKAAEDALALSIALDSTTSINEALESFEQERLTLGHKIIKQAQRLGANKSNPQQVLDETASMTFLSLNI